MKVTKRSKFEQEYDGSLVVDGVIAASPSSEGLTKAAIAQIVADQHAGEKVAKLVPAFEDLVAILGSELAEFESRLTHGKKLMIFRKNQVQRLIKVRAVLKGMQS